MTLRKSETLLGHFARVIITWSTFILVSFLLTGCGDVELYTRLQEREANLMIAILLERGINAEKATGEENTFMIKIPQRRFAEAVELLREHGYPRTEFMGVGEAFQKSGLVSSPSEERIRYMFALSQDLAKTLTLIDGVIDARVHLVLPDNNPFTETFYPASAAVFIDYRPDSNVINDIPQIKNMIVNSIEGLHSENVSVALFPVEIQTGFGGLKKGADTTSFLFIDVPQYSFWPLVTLVLFFIMIIIILLGIVLYMYIKGGGEINIAFIERMAKKQQPASREEE